MTSNCNYSYSGQKGVVFLVSLSIVLGFMVKSYLLADPGWICEGRLCLSSISGYVQHGSKIVIEIGEGGSSSGA